MNPNFLLNMPMMPVMISEDCNAPELRSRRHYESGYCLRRSRALRAAASLGMLALAVILAV